MAAYRFYAPADATQDKIWRDTVNTWGEAQAEAYIRGLHAYLQRLCGDHLLCDARCQRYYPNWLERVAWANGVRAAEFSGRRQTDTQ